MGLNDWIRRAGRAIGATARRLGDDARGNVAMMVGLTLPVLVMLTFGGVDLHRASGVRVQLQDALDAATLAAARSPYTANTDLQRIGMASLKANLAGYPGITLREGDTSFVLDKNVVIAKGRVDVKTLVANIIMPPYGKLLDDTMPVGATSEVDRSSRNLEVALALDITGSMQGQKLLDLKEAAKDLVDLVVQPVQTPYYSKLALVPWSMSVNPGNALTAVRGGVVGSTNITGAVINLAGAQKAISFATQARPVVVTSTAHGFANNEVVWITGVSGMTQLNNKPYLVRSATADSFQLYNLSGSRVDGRAYNAHSGSTGKVQRCQNNDCSITITANNHGLSNNDYVYITNVNGMTQINNEAFLVGNVTPNSYTIDLTDASLSTYTSGGKSWCAQPGCFYYTFTNGSGNLRTHSISNCVTERTGSERYTDAAVGSSARVGRHYPYLNPNVGVPADCLGSTIKPLSTNIATIKSDINALSTNGVTAGQIGIAWGWYMVSPNFASLWPGAGAASYNTAETLKAVVIMTDGEFNAPYCGGVIVAGYGANNTDSSACEPNNVPDNAEPYTQSRALCAAMRAQGIVVYTVGFQIPAGGGAESLLSDCASTPSGYFNAGSGAELSEAFAAIGRDITRLRISK